MRRIKFILILFNVLIIKFELHSQFYNPGQDASKTKWLQIDTNNFRLIFPKDYQNEALKIADFLQFSISKNSQTLSRKPVKIPIILHNQTVVSNGFVTWAPKRSEWYVCPPFDMYAQNWNFQLALHEYRHVVQVSQMYRGFSKWLYYPFGEMGVASVAGVYLPRWFLEGDAVVMETALSESGRGRIPDFTMDLKAQLTDKRKYNYNKALFGSYKDYTPDAYTLGYQLVSEARINYGKDVFDKTLKYVARNPFLIVPFSQGLKKNINLNITGLYNKTIDNLQLKYKAEQELKIKNLTTYDEIINDNPKKYTSYRFPQYLNDTTIIAVKSEFGELDKFIQINGNKEIKQIIIPGNYSGQPISVSKNLIVWTEKIPDLKWTLRNYSVIKIFDFKNGKTRRLTGKSRYFSPSLSNDAKKIACVEITIDNKYFLVILNSENGEIINKIPTPENIYITTPKWNTEDKKIIMIAAGDEGKSLLQYNLENQSFKNILKNTFNEISSPVYFKNFILFHGNINETNEIMGIDTLTSKMYTLTNSKYGTTDVSITI